MKNIFTLFLLTLMLLPIAVVAQEARSTYYVQRVSLFDSLPIDRKDIVFVGNSITDGCEWSELFDNLRIKNRGISGDTTTGLLERLHQITQGKPKKLFLLIGVNDLPRQYTLDSIAARVDRIVDQVQQESPKTKIYLQSLLPLNPDTKKFTGHTARWKEIKTLNQKLEKIAHEKKISYVDLFSHFANPEGKMPSKYSNDGLHLMGPGYLLWKDIITQYVQ